MSSRPIRSLAALVAAAFVLGLLGTPPRALAQARPLKVGVLIPVSGVFAAPGEYMRDGLELYLKEHNGTLGGRRADLVVLDDKADPQFALTQLRKLVEQEHVDVLFGVLTANEGAALVPYINEHKVPAIYPIVSAEDLTQRAPSPYIVRTAWSSGQPTHVLGDYAYRTLHYRRVATIAYDFNFGWESVGGFVDAFQSEGGKIVKQVWTPLVTSDYSPYLSALPRDVDAVMCSYSGSAAINFIRQYRAFGLRMPLVCQGNTTDESTLQATGPAALGIVTALHYSAALDTRANRDFVAAYQSEFNRTPSYYSEGTYVGAGLLDRALGRVQGNAGDVDAFMRALKHTPIPNAPRGPVAFDALGNPIENEYVRRVEDKGGQLVNTVVSVYHGVSQFWTFDHQQYLSHPVYSRSYPPCNACS